MKFENQKNNSYHGAITIREGVTIYFGEGK